MKNVKFMSDLKEVNLSRNHFEDEFMFLLGPLIASHMSKIEVLSLEANNLSEQGLACLGPWLENNQYLRVLNLSYNKLRDPVSLPAFTQSLAKASHLKELSLKMCKITDALMKELVSGLPPGLAKLNLSYNRITKDGL